MNSRLAAREALAGASASGRQAARPFVCQIPGHLVMCLALEVKLELSELAPEIIEEIATILAGGYLRLVMAEAKNQTTWPSDGIAPDENLARSES